jgi:hypothetical protein
MYYDLSIPWPVRPSASSSSAVQSKKQKGKSKASASAAEPVSQAAPLKSGIDVLSPQDRQELRRSVEMAIHCQSLPFPSFDLGDRLCSLETSFEFRQWDSRRSHSTFFFLPAPGSTPAPSTP